MDNKTIAKTIRLLSQLMELHDENPFKVKSFAAVAFRLDKLPQQLDSLSLAELETIEGVGKSTAGKIHELCTTGKIGELENLIARTPEGILAIMKIKGLGPKKVQAIWNELGIESVEELYYACNENRLVEAKGFGDKTQEEIKKNIEFLRASLGKFHYAAVEKISSDLVEQLSNEALVSVTGAIRRKCEIIEKVEILIGSTSPDSTLKNLNSIESLAFQNSTDAKYYYRHSSGIPVEFTFSNPENFYRTLFLTTGSKNHLHQLNISEDTQLNKASSEQEIYSALQLPYLEPELREGLGEIELAKQQKLPQLIEVADLKGILHNHSTYSDGAHSLEEMARYCKELGYEYLGICDHSQTAVYAKGLKPEKIIEQHREVDELNEKLSPFKVFKGIESDILSTGSLDYPEEILKTFDFIVASIHQGLKMDQEKATERLIKAVENPYTTILGHPTGRLLLGREGYPIDHAKVIDACAANGVVIELNANPQRLDLDWHWIPYAMEKGVKISINPDAHRKEGYHDMYFGVCVARKGRLTKEMCFNALSLKEITSCFEKRK